MSKKGILVGAGAAPEGWRARSGSSGSAFTPKTPPSMITSCKTNSRKAVNGVQCSPQADASTGVPKTPRSSASSSGTSLNSRKHSPLQELSMVWPS